MIVGIDGGLGSGKTYTAVWLAAQEASARPIFANFDLAIATRVWTWRELCALRSGMFLWDEAHLDIDSRMFGSNVSVTPWLTQTRKLGMDIVYMTQSYDQVDKRLRNLTDVLIRCSRVVAADSRRGTRMMVINIFEQKVVTDAIMAHDTGIYALYDTHQMVIPLQGTMPTLAELVEMNRR